MGAIATHVRSRGENEPHEFGLAAGAGLSEHLLQMRSDSVERDPEAVRHGPQPVCCDQLKGHSCFGRGEPKTVPELLLRDRDCSRWIRHKEHSNWLPAGNAVRHRTDRRNEDKEWGGADAPR